MPVKEPKQPQIESADIALTEHDVARFYGVSVFTVQQWRSRGYGPPYRKLNGHLCRYRLEDLRAHWASLPVGPLPAAAK